MILPLVFALRAVCPAVISILSMFCCALVFTGSGHEAELARQGAHLSSILEGVGEEGKVNRELAGLLVERLDSSRK
jgi:hypothetical protein